MGDARLVLMYHRVAAVAPDVHGLQVAPERFAAQLEVIDRRADVVPLDEVVAPGRGRRVAITFDDGYVDNLLAARPALSAAGMPATMFVSSGYVGRTDGFWPDRLATFLLSGPLPVGHLDTELGGRRVLVDVGSEPARRRAYWFAHRHLGGLAADDVEAALARLFAAGGRVPEVPASSWPLGAEQLRELATAAEITIGGHGVTHTRLSLLDEPAQRTEIEGSRAQLEALAGVPVRWFAYPYGTVDAFDTTSVAVARGAYDLAVTTVARPVDDTTDRYRVPRFNVGDWSADELSARLDEWLAT